MRRQKLSLQNRMIMLLTMKATWMKKVRVKMIRRAFTMMKMVEMMMKMMMVTMAIITMITTHQDYNRYNSSVIILQTGSEIAPSWSPMRLKI